VCSRKAVLACKMAAWAVILRLRYEVGNPQGDSSSGTFNSRRNLKLSYKFAADPNVTSNKSIGPQASTAKKSPTHLIPPYGQKELG